MAPEMKQPSEEIIEARRLDLDTLNTPVLVSERREPLRAEQWSKLLDSDGRVVDESKLRKIIFKGGVEKKLRKEVWRFLFGFYPFSSTLRERRILAAESYLRYSALKARWKELLKVCPPLNDGFPDSNPTYLKEFEDCVMDEDNDVALSEIAKCIGQEQLEFMKLPALINASRQPIDVPQLQKLIRVIDKDVPRTDRSHPYFCGSENRNLLVVRDILITYAAYHPDVGYVQGINDLLSRFLVVLDSEAEAYWCLENYIDHVREDFLEKGMMKRIDLVIRLLKKMDPKLYEHFKLHEMQDLLFVHRWLILGFKREFSFEDALTLFEILSSQHLEMDSLEGAIARENSRKHESENVGGEYQMEEAAINTDFTFDLFLCLAILEEYREKLFECDEVSKVYDLISNLSMKMDLTVILMKAEELFYRYCDRSIVDSFQLVDMNFSAQQVNRNLSV